MFRLLPHGNVQITADHRSTTSSKICNSHETGPGHFETVDIQFPHQALVPPFFGAA